MARDGGPTPALGWCDPVLRKHPIERFVSRTRIFDTKRSNDDFRVTFQTTLVPLHDRCRSAALPLLISGGEPEKCPIFNPLHWRRVGVGCSKRVGPTPEG